MSRKVSFREPPRSMPASTNNMELESLEELKSAFPISLSLEGGTLSGFVPVDELAKALEVAHVRLPGHRVRELQEEWTKRCKEGDKPIEKYEADKLLELLKKLRLEQDPGQSFLERVQQKDMRKLSAASGGQHAVHEEEQVAYADWLNKSLGGHPHLRELGYLPLRADGEDLFEKCSDSVLICCLIEHAFPGTISEQAINMPLTAGQVQVQLQFSFDRSISSSSTSVDSNPDPGSTSTLSPFPNATPPATPASSVSGAVSAAVSRQASMTTRTRKKTVGSQDGKLSVFQALENGTLALNSARALGCKLVNIEASDIHKGTPWLVLSLLSQLIKAGLLAQVSLNAHPELAALLDRDADETPENLRKLPPETLLLRWINFQLKVAGSKRHVDNFTTDLQDAEVLLRLVKQIAPAEKGVYIDQALAEKDPARKACLLLEEVGVLGSGCRVFISAESLAKRLGQLNLAFVANLFHQYPSLKVTDLDQALARETREEKTYRNWLNSLGVTPYVNYLYTDLTDGLVLLQLYELISPGVVERARVHWSFSSLKEFLERLENCNYVVELGRRPPLSFKLMGIAGDDISKGARTPILGLLSQAFKAHTLALLAKLAAAAPLPAPAQPAAPADDPTKSNVAGDSNAASARAPPRKTTAAPIGEREILAWANDKLAKRTSPIKLTGFNDPSISDSRPIFELLDSIKPRSVSFLHLKDGSTPENKLANAKYAVSAARKAGAQVYALPEDLVELNQKMVLTVFAALMALDLQLLKNKPEA